MSRRHTDPHSPLDDYAASLLAHPAIGAHSSAESAVRLDPELEWARSGAMWLTGEADGPPVLAPGPFALAAARALNALATLSDSDALRRLDGAALLGERAACWGATRRGRTSPGGSCRLLRCADGWLALNLARPDDVALIPALLEQAADDGSPWRTLERALPGRSAAEWVARGRLMGLPIAPCELPRATPPDWLRAMRLAPPRLEAATPHPLVLDLSSLWAGPLCSGLLGLAGARVVKIESTRRPDGARSGPALLFDLLNSGKEMVALDFADPGDLRRLRALLERADIVIESARPRALAQLGIDAEASVRARPGLTWLGITGYGRRPPEGDWVAFGDDAAVAAGAAMLTGGAEARPLFCGDALADPLAGTHAALAAWACHRAGGGELLDVSLRDVTEHVLGWRRDPERASRVAVERDPGETGWRVRCADAEQPVLRPRARVPDGPAGALGRDTRAVLVDLLGDAA